MFPPFAFRGLRVLGALLVFAGLVAAALGGVTVASTPAPPAAHGVAATPVESSDSAAALSELNESQRELAARAIENGRAGGPEGLAASLDERAVSAGNATYRLRAYRSEPGVGPFGYLLYGGLVLAVFGFFLAAGSHLTLRVRPA